MQKGFRSKQQRRRRDGGDVFLLWRGDPVPKDDEEPQSYSGALQGAAPKEGQLQVCLKRREHVELLIKSFTRGEITDVM